MLAALFSIFLEIGISVSVVLAALFLGGRFLDRKFAVKWRYWVWLALAIRLLVPLNLTLPSPPVQIPVEGKMETAAPEEAAMAPETSGADAVSFPQTPGRSRHAAALPTVSPRTLLDWAALVWLLGAAAFLCWQLGVYRACRREVLRWGRPAGAETEAVFRALKDDLGLSESLRLLESPKASGPMVLGLLRPVVVLPPGLFRREQLELVLRHELVHCKRKDIWYKTLLLLARAVHWFNPLVHWMGLEAGRDIEFSCDEEVVSGRDQGYRKAYSEAILQAMAGAKGWNPALSTAFHSGKKTMKRRFLKIFDETKKRRGYGLLALVCIAALAFGGCVAVGNKTEGAEGPAYTSQTWGIKLNFPESWRDHYVVVEGVYGDGKNIDVFEKGHYDKQEGMGLLFSVRREDGGDIRMSDISEPVKTYIAAQNERFTYFVYLPGDVNWDPNDPDLEARYMEMNNQIEEVVQNCEIVEASNARQPAAGYKIVGNAFFNLEIPEGWTMERDLDDILSWTLLEGGAYRGTAAMTSYKKEAVTGPYRIYKAFDEAERAVDLYYDPEVPEDTAAHLADTLELTYLGAYNYYDFEVARGNYIAQGVVPFYGRIVETETESYGEGHTHITNLTIEKVALIADDTQPRGIRVESLGERVTYSGLFGDVCLMSILGDNNPFGICSLDSFRERYPDLYENGYYEFIVANDAVVQVWAAYLP